MIQSNKIFRAFQDARIMAQRVSKNILKIRFSNTFFNAKSNKKPDLTHQWYLTWPIQEFMEIVRISYQKLDFHGISRFSAVSSSIISMLWGTNQELLWIKKVYLSFLSTGPKKKPQFVQNLNFCSSVLRKFSVL
jgi:hypothetical protein